MAGRGNERRPPCPRRCRFPPATLPKRTRRRSEMQNRTIVALFDDYRDAEGAIRELEAMGIPSTDINLIVNNTGNRYGDYPQYGLDRPDRTDTGSAAGAGAGVGAVLGGTAGLL